MADSSSMNSKIAEFAIKNNNNNIVNTAVGKNSILDERKHLNSPHCSQSESFSAELSEQSSSDISEIENMEPQ